MQKERHRSPLNARQGSARDCQTGAQEDLQVLAEVESLAPGATHRHIVGRRDQIGQVAR